MPRAEHDVSAANTLSATADPAAAGEPLQIDALALQRDGLTFRFDLQLQPGELLVLIGPSGAGKSTLLDLLSGFVPPDGGDVHWQGRSLLGLPPAERPFTTLFQDNNLFEHLSVAQNIALGLSPSLRLTSEQWQHVEAAAARLGIAECLPRRPTALSGGQQQRVALARSLVRRRPFLLLDEPFSALDPALRRELLQTLRQLSHSDQVGILLVSHHPEEASQVADRLALVEQGQIAYCGTPDALNDPAQAALRRYLGHG